MFTDPVRRTMGMSVRIRTWVFSKFYEKFLRVVISGVVVGLDIVSSLMPGLVSGP